MKEWLSSLVKGYTDKVKEGIITLTVEEFYDLFTEVFAHRDVAFFWASSRIDPRIWKTPALSIYLKRESETVREYERLPGSKKREISEKIRERISSFDGTNFERIFLVSDTIFGLPDSKKKEILLPLCDVIREHSENQIRPRVIIISTNEKSTLRRPQDFAIGMLRDGTFFGMYLDVDERGKPLGGYLIVKGSMIDQLVDAYLKLRAKSRDIKLKEKDEILNFILNLPRNDISQDIYGNRCLDCLLDAEDKVLSGEWKRDRSGKKFWYEIIFYENVAIGAVFKSVRPKSVLEVGVGPGRVLRLIKREAKKLRIDVDLVGYEQNPDICAIAISRVGTKIFPIYVGKDKEGKFHHLLPQHKGKFDLVIGVSNLLGWQDDEAMFVSELYSALTKGGYLFLTVYKTGVELERARMYRSAGDILRFTKIRGRKQIELVSDAFKGEYYISRAYAKEDLKQILDRSTDLIQKDYVDIPYHKVFPISKYQWGILIRRGKPVEGIKLILEELGSVHE